MGREEGWVRLWPILVDTWHNHHSIVNYPPVIKAVRSPGGENVIQGVSIFAHQIRLHGIVVESLGWVLISAGKGVDSTQKTPICFSHLINRKNWNLHPHPPIPSWRRASSRDGGTGIRERRFRASKSGSVSLSQPGL